MSRFGNRLSIISLTLLVAVVIMGCSQPDDILTGVSKSTMTLTAERLPTPPTGMVYELWLSKVADPDTSVSTADIKSLGKFSYIHNDSLNVFLDADGNVRTNLVELNEDILKYKSVFVSVELATDPDASRPGPIMLTGTLSSDPDAVLRMDFPKSDSLFESTCWLNMMTVSDEDPGNIGQGVWFCGWRTENRSIPDTVALRADSSRWDTMEIERDPVTHEITNLDSLTREYPDVLDSIYLDTTFYFFGQDSTPPVRDTFIYGADSFQHIRMHYHTIKRADLDSPYTRRNLRISVDTVPRIAALQVFSQQQFGMPRVDRYGWKYAGWVVTPTLSPTNDSIGSFSAPGYPIVTGTKTWFSGSSGGLISTGTFSRIDSADDMNRFQVKATRIPGYPGEEFTNLALVNAVYGVPQINFIPNVSGNSGNIFISMEPANRLTDTTNFPLIAYSVDIPSRRTDFGLDVATPVTNVQFRMFNLTGTVSGYLNMGFPEISAKIKRY